AARAVPQQHDDEHAPLLADPREDLTYLAAVLMQRMLDRSGHLDMPWSDKFASLRYGKGHISRLGLKHGPRTNPNEAPPRRFQHSGGGVGLPRAVSRDRHGAEPRDAEPRSRS